MRGTATNTKARLSRPRPRVTKMTAGLNTKSVSVHTDTLLISDS